MSKPKILIFAPREEPASIFEQLEGAGFQVAVGNIDWQLPRGNHEDTFAAAARDAVALMGTSIRHTPVSRRIMEGSQRLRIVAKYTVGVDDVDIEAATDLGILVCHSPTESNCFAVAETTVDEVLAHWPSAGLAVGVEISSVMPSHRKESGTRYGAPLALSAVAIQASTSRSSLRSVSRLRSAGVLTDCAMRASPPDQRSRWLRSTGLMSRTGVPSIASKLRTVSDPFATDSIVTACRPIGFGRSGDRVEKTPVSGRLKSPRGWTVSVVRSPR